MPAQITVNLDQMVVLAAGAVAGAAIAYLMAQRKKAEENQELKNSLLAAISSVKQGSDPPLLHSTDGHRLPPSQVAAQQWLRQEATGYRPDELQRMTSKVSTIVPSMEDALQKNKQAAAELELNGKLLGAAHVRPQKHG